MAPGALPLFPDAADEDKPEDKPREKDPQKVKAGRMGAAARNRNRRLKEKSKGKTKKQTNGRALSPTGQFSKALFAMGRSKDRNRMTEDRIFRNAARARVKNERALKLIAKWDRGKRNPDGTWTIYPFETVMERWYTSGITEPVDLARAAHCGAHIVRMWMAREGLS